MAQAANPVQIRAGYFAPIRPWPGTRRKPGPGAKREALVPDSSALYKSDRHFRAQ